MPKLYTLPLLYLPRYRELYTEANIKAIVSGKYKVQVCRHGQVIREPFGDNWIPNLITNTGLDSMIGATNDCLSMMTYARAGSGTTTPSNTDTQLVTQLKSCNTYLGSGNGSTIDTVNGAGTNTRVYEFAAEVGTVTYNEFGVSDQSSGTNIRTRALFPSGVVCNSGDNFRLTYSMTFSVPSLITPVTVSLSAVNGFNISGSLKSVGTFDKFFGTLTAAGSASNSSYWNQLFMGSNASANLTSAPTTFPTVNTGLSATTLGSNVTTSSATYTNGTFTRTATAQWIPSNPSTTVSNVNGIIYWAPSFGSPVGGHYLILSSAQTKANTNTLTVTYSFSMARA
jgi:hypothetical protein